MSELQPEIKRLMNLAKPCAEKDDTAPPGFATRVVARSQQASRQSTIRVRWAFSIASWMAVLVIAGCGLVLARQEPVAPPASQITAAVHFFAENITP